MRPKTDAAGQQREDHEGRVQADDATDHERDDEVVLGVTEHRVHDRDRPDVHEL